MGEFRMRTTGIVIPFPPPPPRRARAEAADGQARGELLLFMGVRYERMPDGDPELFPVIDGRAASPALGSRTAAAETAWM